MEIPLPDFSKLLSADALVMLAFATLATLAVTQLVKELIPAAWEGKGVRVLSLLTGIGSAVGYECCPNWAMVALVGVLAAYLACFGAYPAIKRLIGGNDTPKEGPK